MNIRFLDKNTFKTYIYFKDKFLFESSISIPNYEAGYLVDYYKGIMKNNFFENNSIEFIDEFTKIVLKEFENKDIKIYFHERYNYNKIKINTKAKYNNKENNETYDYDFINEYKLKNDIGGIVKHISDSINKFINKEERYIRQECGIDEIILILNDLYKSNNWLFCKNYSNIQFKNKYGVLKNVYKKEFNEYYFGMIDIEQFKNIIHKNKNIFEVEEIKYEKQRKRYISIYEYTKELNNKYRNINSTWRCSIGEDSNILKITRNNMVKFSIGEKLINDFYLDNIELNEFKNNISEEMCVGIRNYLYGSDE